MDNQILSPDFKPEFGSPPLFTNPFTSPTPSATTPSKHTTKYLNHLNTLGFSQSEQDIIIKLNLDWTLCHTKWPAFHWDMGALGSSVRDWVRSGGGSGIDFGFDADFLYLEPRASVCDLQGEIVVGPMDFSSRSNSAPGPPIAGDLDNFSDGGIVNDDTAEMISSDAKGEDILRCGTPDFKFLQSSPSSNTSPNNSLDPANIPLPLSRVGSGGSSEDSESASHGADLDLDRERQLFRLSSAFNRSMSSVGSDPGRLDPKLALIEVEETEVRSMIGSSFVTLLDSDELDAECLGQMQTTEDFNVDERLVVDHVTSAHEDDSVTDTIKSPEAGSGSSSLDVTLVGEPVKTSIDPIRLSKLTQLSTIPVAGDPSLLRLLSTLPVPPFPFPEPQSDLLGHPIPPTPTQIPAELQIFKKDAELCTKSQIMDTQGTITNEVGAQLRCGCDECRPVAMKALFGDLDWLMDGVLFLKEKSRFE